MTEWSSTIYILDRVVQEGLSNETYDSENNLSNNPNQSEIGISNQHNFESKLTYWEDYIVGVFLFLVGIVSVLLNVLVIVLCILLRKTLLIADYYILNLALSDILLPLIGFPFAIISSFNHEWNFSHIGCQLYGFVGFFCGVVSISTLAIMSFVRYMSVCHLENKNQIVKKTPTFIAFTYLYACLWAIPPLLGWGEYGVESHGTSCTINWTKSKSFVTSMLLMCIIFPVVVMKVCYGSVLVYFKRRCKNLRKWRLQRTVNNQKREGYLIKITFTMCLAFVGTWSPYAVVSLWSAYGDVHSIPIRVTLVAVLIAKLSTVINPLIYCILNKKFRPFINKYFTSKMVIKKSKSVVFQFPKKMLKNQCKL